MKTWKKDIFLDLFLDDPTFIQYEECGKYLEVGTGINMMLSAKAVAGVIAIDRIGQKYKRSL